MTTKFQLLNYLFVGIGMIDVWVFVKIFPTIYVELILVILFILGVSMNIFLNQKNKRESHKEEGFNLRRLTAQQYMFGAIFSLIFLFLLCSTASYTLKMSRIYNQGFDILIGIMFFSAIFFTYKFCDSLFEDGSQLFMPRVGGVYVNPKHPIGELFFLALFLIPVYIILSVIFGGPMLINT